MFDPTHQLGVGEAQKEQVRSDLRQFCTLIRRRPETDEGLFVLPIRAQLRLSHSQAPRRA